MSHSTIPTATGSTKQNFETMTHRLTTVRGATDGRVDVTSPVGFLPLDMSMANSADLGSIQEYITATSLHEPTQGPLLKYTDTVHP